MRKIIAITAVSSLLVATGALAAVQGINPASPNLFTVTKSGIWNANVPNNQGSAMCYDCHTVAPKSATAGTHFVDMVGGATGTNSGGSGIDSSNNPTTRDGGQYFGLSDWSAIDSNGATATQIGGRYSKYYDLSNGLSKMISNTNNPTATTEGTPGNHYGFEFICESCHNVIVNDAGGNLLLANQNNGSDALGLYYTQGPESTLCVGCHGFMFTTNATNAANGNYADTRNNIDGTGTKRDNNEYHWVWNRATSNQEPFKQNHHVMTGDNIDGTMAAQRLLWTDNEIVSYTRNPFANNVSTGSTYPALVSTWDLPQNTAGPNMNCTNCHTPAHLGHISEGASILRDQDGVVDLGGSGTNPTDRIANTAGAIRGFKKFNDAAYCNQCH